MASLRSKLLALLLAGCGGALFAGGSIGGERQRLGQEAIDLAQDHAVSSTYLVGEWVSRSTEFGREVEIFWTLWPDGKLHYRFIVDGVASEGSRGTWTIEGTIVTENWIRPNGETETGRGTIEWIDDNTLRLSIIDNGNADYQGMVRVYRRRGAPQISMLARDDE